MTLREATALILLYRACRDEALLKRARELVPELTELVGELRAPQGFIMTIRDRVGEVVDVRHAVCGSPNEIAAVAWGYLCEFPSSLGYTVTYREAL